jgi:hypothetical protein
VISPAADDGGDGVGFGARAADRQTASTRRVRANWVRNVRAARGQATLRHGRRELVHLDEVGVAERPAILRRYLDIAPGARPHIPAVRHASLQELRRVATQIPVFRITTIPERATEGEFTRSNKHVRWSWTIARGRAAQPHGRSDNTARGPM